MTSIDAPMWMGKRPQNLKPVRRTMGNKRMLSGKKSSLGKSTHQLAMYYQSALQTYLCNIQIVHLFVYAYLYPSPSVDFMTLEKTDEQKTLKNKAHLFVIICCMKFIYYKKRQV